MARTKKLTFYTYGAVREAGITTSYRDNILREIGYETGAIAYTYVMGMKPAYNLLDTLSASAVVQSLTITIDLESSGGSHNVYVGALSSELADYDFQSRYNVIMAAPATWTLATGKKHTITVTDTEQIRKILTYGFGVRPATSGSWTTDMYSPDLEYTYTDPNEPPELTVSAPASAYLCDTMTLSWNYLQASDVTQYGIDVEAVTESGRTVRITTLQATSTHSYSVRLADVNIGAENTVFRVRAYINGGAIVGEWAESAAVTLKNNSLEIVSPKSGENKIVSVSIPLKWKKAADDTSVNDPYGFTVQYSTNAGESWTDLLTKGTAEKSDGVWQLNVSADTFPHGVVQWRVAPWTSQYNAGAYVRETFSAVVQASTSAVSCDGKPMPTLSWSSTSQAAYQVRFADYDSGAVFGASKSHTVPYAYADGLYAAQVRTQTTTGEWSDWTPVQYVQITNTTPTGSVTLTAEKTRHTVILTWTVSGTFDGYVLYRNGIPVYAGKDRQFADNAAAGKNTYFVRAVTASRYYLPSASVTVDGTPKTDCLLDETGGTWIALKFSATPRSRRISRTETVSYRYYAGRRYPIAFTDGFAERSGTFSCCFREREQAEAVEAMAGRTVIYKGTDGTVLRGILNGVSHVSESIHDLSFTVTEIDREERVPYEIA